MATIKLEKRQGRPKSKKAPPDVKEFKTEGHGREAKQERLLSALRGGASRKDACDYAGISRECLYTWMGDLTFYDKVKAAEAAPAITCSSSIITAAKRDWRAANTWLEKRRPEDWRDTKQINVRDLTVEQIFALLARLRAGSDRGVGSGVEAEGGTPALPASFADAVSE
jgi:hypothetical protein